MNLNISSPILSRFFAVPRAAAPVLTKPATDPRIAAYLLAREKHIRLFGDANMDEWEEAQFSNPTGTLYENWVTVYE